MVPKQKSPKVQTKFKGRIEGTQKVKVFQLYECYSISKIVNLGPKKHLTSWATFSPSWAQVLAFWVLQSLVFSLRRGDLIRMSCLSLGPLVDWSVIDFVIFQKERFEIKITTCLIRPSLYCLIHFSKSLPRGLCMYLLV